MGKYSHINFKAPDSVKSAYKRGLELHEEGKTGSGLEAATVSMARKIVSGESISPEWARKGNRFWGRNERFLSEDKDSPAYASAMLWGGRPGKGWFSKLVEQMDSADKDKKSNSFVQLVNRVDPNTIRVEEVGEDRIYIVPSATLPDNVVMNGGLYPADEIAKSYQSLEDTPAPIGHPEDKDGNFVSARSEIGLNQYYAGAVNANVRRKDGRVYLDKRINERVAKKLNRGPELLARLDAMIRGEDTAPIHTSTGVFLFTEDLPEPRTNEKGKKYNWIARDMVFDHDAILFDEPGAATPEDGVGMMVNKDRKLQVNRILVPGSQTSYTKPQADGGLNTNEDSDMLDKLKALLKANKVKIADDATETDVLEATEATIQANMDGDMKKMVMEYMKSGEMKKMISEYMDTKMSEYMKDKMKGNSDDSASAEELAALCIDIGELKAKINKLNEAREAAEKAERDNLIETITANSELTKEELAEMKTNSLQKLAKQHDNAPAYFMGNGAQPEAPNGSGLSNELPE